MDDEVHSVEKRPNGFGVANIRLMKIDMIAHGGEVFDVAGAQVIENPNRFAPPQQLLNRMRADETRAASDQIKGQALPPSTR